jgi:hypothetical protein
MNKKELIQIHQLLEQVKKYFVEKELRGDFTKYDSLGTLPYQMSRTKEQHKEAIFVLLAELTTIAKKKYLTVNK